MASIKDAFEESLQDTHAIIKYIVLAIPVYFCVQLFSDGKMGTFWSLATFTLLIMFGFLIKCTSNVRNGANCVLPPLNPFTLLWTGLKGSVALGPSIAINVWLSSLLCGLVTQYIPEPKTAMGLQICIWGIFGSVILTGYLCYAKTFKIADAYNFKLISESCSDILIAVLFMLPQLAIANAIVIVPVTYVIWVFLGIPHPVAWFYWSVVLVFNLGMGGHYLAQIDYEAIETKNNADKF